VIGADARLAVLVAVVGALGLVAARRRLRLGSSAWMWVAIAGSVAAVVGAYAVSPYDLGWHLLTSLPRTSMAPRLLLLSEVGVWVVCGIEAVVAAWRRRAPTSSMDQASVVAASP
jgi:hypothetical protein